MRAGAPGADTHEAGTSAAAPGAALPGLIGRGPFAWAMTKDQPKRADSYNRENPAYNPNTERPSSGKSGKSSK